MGWIKPQNHPATVPLKPKIYPLVTLLPLSILYEYSFEDKGTTRISSENLPVITGLAFYLEYNRIRFSVVEQQLRA
jgi:hypothetical protein